MQMKQIYSFECRLLNEASNSFAYLKLKGKEQSTKSCSVTDIKHRYFQPMKESHNFNRQKC